MIVDIRELIISKFFLQYILVFVFVVSLAFLYMYLKKRNKSYESNTEDKNKKSSIHQTIKNHGGIFKKTNLSEVNRIIIDESFDSELSLLRKDVTNSENKRFKEITNNGLSVVSQTAQGFTPLLGQAQTLAQINKAFPEGVFSATAPISKLMELSKGGYGSAVVEKGKVVAQAGFVKGDLPGLVNPAAVVGVGMQAMAAISGQYYLDDISKQLSSIDSKLDKLVQMHHDEKMAMLLTAKDGLKAIASKSQVDPTDIIEIRSLQRGASNVYNEYLLRLERIDIDDVTNVKKHKFRKNKWLNKLELSIDDYEINLTLQVCYYADFLIYQCNLAEVATRMKMNNREQHEVIISEQLERIVKDYKESFFINIEEKIESFYSPLHEHAEKIAKRNSFIYKNKNFSDKALDEIERLKKEGESLKDSNKQERYGFTKIMRTIEKPREILYLPSDNQEDQRVFISED